MTHKMQLQRPGETSFDALPLHDAVVRTIEIDWEKKLCRFRLSVVSRSSNDALLAFEGVTWLSMPHNEPWGSSSSVNSGSGASGSFRIEMQSGDIIEITATSYAFAIL